MIIELKNIIPNPYRNIDKYPTDPEKIERLKESYLQRGFWGGLKCRPSPTESGKFELCFGQHRFEALLLAEYTEADFEVHDYTNAQMLHMLVGENEEFLFKRSLKFIDENVEGAKYLIENHINSVNGVWEELDPWCQDLFENKDGFNNSQRNFRVSGKIHPIEVGWTIIQKFLGNSWDKNEINNALKRIRETVMAYSETEIEGQKVKVEVPLSRTAMESFERQEHADGAENALKAETGRIAFPTKEHQEEVIEEVHEHFQKHPEKKKTGVAVKEFIETKALEKIEKEKIPIPTPEYKKNENALDKAVLASREPDEQSIGNMTINRKYFQSTAKSFNDTAVHLDDIPIYPEHLLHYDRALLLKDIVQRLDLLKEYDDALGFPSTMTPRVYDVFDCDKKEEWEVMKQFLEIGKEHHSELPPVEEWIESDKESILDEIRSELEKFKQKDRFSDDK